MLVKVKHLANLLLQVIQCLQDELVVTKLHAKNCKLSFANFGVAIASNDGCICHSGFEFVSKAADLARSKLFEEEPSIGDDMLHLALDLSNLTQGYHLKVAHDNF